MQFIQSLADLPCKSRIKITVSKNNKKVASFITTVKSGDIDNEKYGAGIMAKAVYYEGKRLNFSTFELSLKYIDFDHREYIFPINAVKYDYPNDSLYFYSKSKAKLINKRKAYRFNCDYPTILTVDNSTIRLLGQCRNASYVGISYICRDPENLLSVGQFVHADLSVAENIMVHNVPGQIVRIEDHTEQGQKQIGISIEKPIRDFERMIVQLQKQDLQRQREKSSIFERAN